MTLKEFRYIVALAEERHFGRAAAKCFVTEPTISVAIHNIEKELGVRLFERGKTHVVATEIGEKIVIQARRVLDEVALVRDIAQQGRDQLSGPLRLGVIPTVGPYLLPSVLPKLRECAPAMSLAIEEDITANLAVLLRRGSLDVIILTLPFEETDAIVLHLYDEPFAVVVPRGHRWEKRQAIKPRELESENVLLLHGGHCFRDQVLTACPALSHSYRDSTQGNSLETIRNMVACGFGITVLPCSALLQKDHPDLLHAIAFEGAAPSRRVALAWRRTFARPAAIEALRKSVLASTIPCLRMSSDSRALRQGAS